MTNTRMLVLFFLLFVGQPVYYFWFELIPLNVLFIYLMSCVRKKWLKSTVRALVAGADNSALRHFPCSCRTLKFQR